MSDSVGLLAKLPSGRRSKWAILALWIVLAVVLGPLFGKIEDYEDRTPSGSLPRGAESTAVMEELDKYRSASEAVPVVAVYTRESGIQDADRNKVEADRTAFAKFADGGAAIQPAIPSQDGKALMLVVPLTRDDVEIDFAVKDLRTAAQAGAPAGLDVDLGGPGGLLNDYTQAFENLDVNLMIATSSIVIVLLLLIYRSPFLWIFPLLAVGFASALTQGVAYLLAKNAGLPVNPASSSLLMILLFGVGTDYALLLIARYREELRRHADKHLAMGIALRRSGPAILASAATVVVGLACLALADMQSARSLGLVGATGVLCAYLAMVTILPALLVIAGRWVFWPFVPKFGQEARAGRGFWSRIGTSVGRHPRVVWLGCLIVIGGLAVSALDIKMGLAQTEVFQTKPQSVTAQEKLARHFPSGASDPAILVADASAAGPVKAAAAGVDGTTVGQESPSPDGKRVIIDVVLRDAPDSDAAKETIDEIRNAVHAVPGANAKVGGTTAETLDIDRASSRDAQVVIPVVLAVILLFLIILLRALVAPLVLLGTVVASYFAALGASHLLFKHVFGHEGTAWQLPLVSFVFLAALGVDYNIFLMTRVHEEAARHGHAEGVRRGLSTTGSVITSAGIVLAATFAVFASMPVVDMIQFGVVVAVGVLLDAFLVRTLLVPALSFDIGRASWWPGRLYRDLGKQASAPVSPGVPGPVRASK
ncbi:RND superfamily putative drug exporter [Micromonospora sp. A200]|uniref:MMPL family transporter n=1 Tax=Micromonospora sp. A200 TaxID=2940568 RepID=UPI00247302F9|nr:MMPL family transporter [Micromonospora sp. A200]MDH6465882.1 RND superfamily putative drug exporter [Micromonospora sp. A200]